MPVKEVSYNTKFRFIFVMLSSSWRHSLVVFFILQKPLQFQMMYYSFLYEQNDSDFLRCFRCYQEKMQVAGASMSYSMWTDSFHTPHKHLDMCLIEHIYLG